MVKLIFKSSLSAARDSDGVSEPEFPMLSLEEGGESIWLGNAELSSYAAFAFNGILPRKMAKAANTEDVFILEIVQNIILLCYEVGDFADEEEFFCHFTETIDLSKLDWLSEFLRPEMLSILSLGARARASDKSWAVHAFVYKLLEFVDQEAH